MPTLSGLIAYPSAPASIGTVIRSTLEILRSEGAGRELGSWEENDIPGRFIVDPILERIDEGNIFVADITRLNFNVTFEVGYAIGRRKRAVLISNSAIRNSPELLREVGLFDTLGFERYSTSRELATKIIGVSDLAPLLISEQVNLSAPVYIVMPRIKDGRRDTDSVTRQEGTPFFPRVRP